MAKRISKEKRALILALLAEGTAINAVARVTKTGKNQILKLIIDTGAACWEWHNRHAKALECNYVQADEIWSYIHTKQNNLPRGQYQWTAERGDCWTFTAIDPESKLLISWETGTREQNVTEGFLRDILDRVDGNFQLSTDGYRPYQNVMRHIHEGRVDFGIEVKKYGSKWDQEKKIYLGDRLTSCERTVVIGYPNEEKINTSHVERHNLTIRQQMKRFARKTLGYSKKYENHCAAIDMFMFIYNYCRKSESKAIKGKTPGMAAGITDAPLSLERVVELTDLYLKKQEEAEFERAFSLKYEKFELATV